MTLILSGTDGLSDVDGSASTPAIRGTDANTGIFFPAADTIAFAEGGVEAMRIDSSGNVGIGVTPASGNKLQVQGTDSTYNVFAGTTNAVRLSTANSGVASVEGTDKTGTASYQTLQVGGSLLQFTISGAEAMRIDSSGNVGIGTSSPDQRLTVWGSNLSTAGAPGNINVYTTNTAAIDVGGSIGLGGYYNGTANYIAYAGIHGKKENATANNSSGYLAFVTRSNTDGSVERARITSDGNFLSGTSSTNGNGVSLVTGGAHKYVFSQHNSGDSDAACYYANRANNDGKLIEFRQAGTAEGDISVSGATVSYNSFCGGHWSQLQEGRGYNPDISRGTVMSSIGEMSEWKSVTWTETIEHEATEDKEAWTESIPHRKAYLGNLPIGATFEEDGFIKTVVDDGNERLPKVKISDVVGDKAVYGVFQTWDGVQDMLISALGAFVVRIAAGVTVQIGDLLESNGDGCAKVQDDDVIRSKTIGKVTSTVATATYADGSYTVPCVLYCG